MTSLKSFINEVQYRSQGVGFERGGAGGGGMRGAQNFQMHAWTVGALKA